jgi:hypothetical protein
MKLSTAVFFGFTLFGVVANAYAIRLPDGGEPGLKPAAFIVGWGFILAGWFLRRLLLRQERPERETGRR